MSCTSRVWQQLSVAWACKLRNLLFTKRDAPSVSFAFSTTALEVRSLKRRVAALSDGPRS